MTGAWAALGDADVWPGAEAHRTNGPDVHSRDEKSLLPPHVAG
jgi:hypothetical protein